MQTLRKEFEILHIKTGESVNEYFARTLTVVNKMKANGENKGNMAVVEKILRSMTPKFDYVVCSIEQSKDIDTLTIDELQSSLLVHEQRMSSHDEGEHALKITYGDQFEEGVVAVETREEKEGGEADNPLTRPRWNAIIVTS